MSRLRSSIRDLILTQKDINKSLELAEVYGSMLWAVDSGVYDDPELEDILTERCMGAIQKGETHLPLKDCIHIISEPYLIGGHTRLMEQLSTMHPEKPDLLITRQSDERAIERTKNFFNESILVEHRTPFQKISEIIESLKAYERVILHIHPDDIHAVIACRILKKITGAKIFFVNHADHVFTYGSTVADVYFEISVFGKHRDMKKTISGGKSFLGIPLSNQLVIKKHHLPEREDILNFFSAASPFKFKPIKGYDPRPTIHRVLSEFKNSTFWIVGANPYTNIWWWPLKIKYWRRFKILSSVPYAGYLKLLERADFYVDSYPIPGGTAFAEQLVSGRRCVGLRAPIQGYSPADNLKSESVDDLIASILQFDNDESVIELVCSVNGYEAVKSRYLACLYSNMLCANELEKHVVWTGDIAVYEEIGKITSAIPPAAIVKLISYDKRFLLEVLRELSIPQKIKMVIKLSILMLKNVAGKSLRSDRR
ncbi:group 1 glycosyl transferase [Pseudomonas poae]|uniref:group 1 glycosyl transferase n=1 Tax=Pseudomonas poae TaxID=200451 RepID=UPI001644DC3F|nr:group 1 glycosyl transferase [Pseudomonas poae]MBC3199452.1 group 1 glycosyl transferase [Pseudomonas poae]